MSVLAILAGLIGILLTAVVLGLLAGLRGLVAKEAEAIAPAVSRGLLQRAVERLPVADRPRFEEEWPAELREALRERPLWALAQAASLYRSAGKLARALEEAPRAPGQASRGSLATAAAGFRQAVSQPIESARSVAGSAWEFLGRVGDTLIEDFAAVAGLVGPVVFVIATMYLIRTL